jgi:hypothetical protein
VREALAQLDAVLGQGAAASRFPPNSRYHATPTARLLGPDGREIAYLRRRFVPPPESLALVREHVVVEGDRLDLLAARHLGDPELFWQLCDANGAVRPDELTETVGRRLRITLPEGLPGAADGR